MAVVKSINDLRTYLSENSNQRPIYMTSGGFDPIHVGHVRCIRATVTRARNKDIHPWEMLGLVVVVVNADSFLERKKGYAFMPVEERMEIIENTLQGLLSEAKLIVRGEILDIKNNNIAIRLKEAFKILIDKVYFNLSILRKSISTFGHKSAR